MKSNFDLIKRYGTTINKMYPLNISHFLSEDSVSNLGPEKDSPDEGL